MAEVAALLRSGVAFNELLCLTNTEREMFVSTRRFEARMDYMEREYKDLANKYWKLSRAHYLLLNELGLHEVEQKATTLLLKKGGPEPSDT